MTYTVVQSKESTALIWTMTIKQALDSKIKRKRRMSYMLMTSENLYLVSSVLLHILGMWATQNSFNVIFKE